MRAPIAIETIGSSPNRGMIGLRKIPARMLQTLNAEGAMAGRKNDPQALSIPISRAARRDEEQERRHDSGHLNRQLELIRLPRKTRGLKIDKPTGAEIDRQRHDPQNHDDRIDHQVREEPGPGSSALLQLGHKRRDKSRTQRAFCKKIAQQIRNAIRDIEGVGEAAGSEVMGHHDLTEEPQNPADGRGEAYKSGSTGDRSRVGGPRLERTIMLERCPHWIDGSP